MIVLEGGLKQKPMVYRIQEFAALAGVTIRALHHYDRLGLLKPSGCSNAGYRLYRDCDLARLEQIVVLKFLGLPLKQIGRLLKRESPLADTLRRQQLVLAEKRQQLDAAIVAIAHAERSMQSGREPDWDAFKKIVREIEMQNNTEWGRKYYSAEAQAKLAELKKKQPWTPELQAQVTKDWTTLLADVEAALGEDPADPKAQALAARWRKLVDGFTGGDPEIQKGLNRMWADKANWPKGDAKRFQINPAVQEFIVKAMKASS
ncbi:MAG: MerR family transcriptional regulator [Acidobacteria bacterium]|nr:MerR family transcriptional regulator [Acidobacteriota bacterium]